MKTKFAAWEDEEEAEENSRLLKGIPDWAKETFANKEIAPHFHIYCLPKNTFCVSTNHESSRNTVA